MVTLVSTSAASTIAGTDLTVPVPAGAVEGDLIVYYMRAQSSVATAGFVQTGFTSVGPTITYPSTALRVNTVLVKRVTSTPEPTGYLFARPANSGTTRMIGLGFLLRGVATDAVAASLLDTATAFDGYDVPDGIHSYTMLFAGAEFSAGVAHTANEAYTAQGFTNINNTTTSSDTAQGRTVAYVMAAADKDPVPSGNLSWAGAASSPIQYGVTFRGAAVAPPAPADGFRSVTQFLHTQGATCAHRGLGGSYAEMSMYGYQQAAQLGHGMLEVSVHRTSDGVWFGLHDNTLARTSPAGTNTSANVNTLTWAQVNANQITIGASGGSQPYAKLVDIAAAFPNHTLMLDPKDSGFTTEFLNLCDTLGGPTRVLVKGFRGFAFLTDAKNRGYQTAAYIYGTPSDDDPVDPALATWIGQVNTIGLNYDATQGEWDTLAAAVPDGKTLWAHTINSQATYNTAITKGANWVQVTSANVTPVGPAESSGGAVGDLPITGASVGTRAVVAMYVGTEQVYG